MTFTSCKTGRSVWLEQGEGGGQEKFCRTSLSLQSYTSLPPCFPCCHLLCTTLSDLHEPGPLHTVHYRPCLTQTLGLTLVVCPLPLSSQALSSPGSLPTLQYPTPPTPLHETFIPQGLGSSSPASHFVSIAQSAWTQFQTSGKPYSDGFPRADLIPLCSPTLQLPAALLGPSWKTCRYLKLSTSLGEFIIFHPPPICFSSSCLLFWLLVPNLKDFKSLAFHLLLPCLNYGTNKIQQMPSSLARHQ